MKKRFLVICLVLLCLLFIVLPVTAGAASPADVPAAPVATEEAANIPDMANQFIELVDSWKLVTLVVLIFANFLLAVAVSFKTKTFRLKHLADFLYTRILPYIISYMAVAFVAVIEPDWKAAVVGVWGIIILAQVGAIMQNLKEIGINLPDFLGGGAAASPPT